MELDSEKYFGKSKEKVLDLLRDDLLESLQTLTEFSIGSFDLELFKKDFQNGISR